MKIFLVLLSIITLYPIVGLPQVPGVYALNETLDKNTDCYIYLFPSGLYEIRVEEHLPYKWISEIEISYGSYTLKNGEIEFSDKYNGFKMLFGYRDNYMIAKKTFKWMLNKKFVKATKYHITGDAIFTLEKIESLNQERIKFQRLHKQKTPFESGVYGNSQGFSYNLRSDNIYKITYKKIVLSEGIWYRIGNELVLKDNTLKHFFYILIDRKNLVSKFLAGIPGTEEDGLLFKNFKEQRSP